MNYKQARIFFCSLTIIAVLLLAGLVSRGCSRKAEPTPLSAATTAVDTAASHASDSLAGLDAEVRLPALPRLRDLAQEFNDLNDAHIAYARKIGLKPIGRTRDIMAQTRPVVEVKTCDDYVVDRLKHSYAFLVPEAATLLADIGSAFNAKLAERNAGHYRIIATSLLRTSESVGRLKRGNANSTENSAHLYGSTFDISYVRFHEESLNIKKHSDGELKLILAEVLKELRQQGRCLVKYERKQGCFHITATGL